MRNFRPDLLRAGAVLAAAALTLTAESLSAQVREVLSSQIAVSSRDASLTLEFANDGRLEIAFRGGEVTVDGERMGGYERGDALDTSWRSLLGDAVSLDDGPLARALIAWEPPEELTGDPAALAERIDGTLEDRLSAPAGDAPSAEAGATRSTGSGQSLAALLRQTDRLRELGEALEGLNLADVRIHVDEDVTVEEGSRVDGTVLVVDGDIDVRGEVTGDVVLVDGALRVYEGGRIGGAVRLVDGRIFREGGTIEGPVQNVLVDRDAPERSLDELRDRLGEGAVPDLDELRDEIRNEVRRELRDELRTEIREEIRRDLRGRGSSVFAPLRSVGRGLAGLLQNVIGFVIVCLLGIAAVHFFPENVAVVADAARKNPTRAAVVGAAGAFLLIPVWALGAVALVISIVGIPALLAWIPLFPVAACLAAALGYLAVARNLGEWIARQGYPRLDFLRPSNAFHVVVAGLGALMLPFALANVVEMGGQWLGFLQFLFVLTGSVAGVVAVTVGFGAVLLTRAGRRSEWRSTTDPFDFSGDWEPEEPDREDEWADLERSARARTGEKPRRPGEGDADRAEDTGAEGPETDEPEPTADAEGDDTVDPEPGDDEDPERTGG